MIPKRKVWPLPGGVRPPENKDQSNQTPVVKAPTPSKLIVPLQQHVGNAAKPVVSAGKKVLKGQIIAQADGFISVPIHAPTSGKILDVIKHPIPHPSGMDDLCVIIEPDGKETWVEKNSLSHYQSLEPGTVIDHIRQAGIAGLGGAGFPTSVKLTPREHAIIHTLIINGIECEPYITADDRLMRDRADAIISGIEVLNYLLKTENCLIGIEENKPEAIQALQTALDKSAIANNCEIVPVPTIYPSGGEKQLIYILTGKEVPTSGIPADVGIVCHNVGTAAAIHQVIHEGKPLISRITTITGKAVSQPQNVEALIGTPIEELLNFCGLNTSKLARLIMGGPMMGFSLSSTELPIIKTTNCIIAATADEIPNPEPAQPCIRCGMCAEVCPADLLPQQLYWYSKAKDYQAAQQYNIFDCIECGACSYVCPSNIPLVQYYRHTKGEIRLQEIEKIKSDRSRKRFDFHTERLEKEQAEKEAKRQARLQASKAKQAAKNQQDGKADVIAAAVARSQAKKTENKTDNNNES